MRKELKIIGSKERHVFTATFIRFGFRDGYKGPVKTILLQDVLLDGKVVTDHLWFDLTKGFKNADLLPGDVVEFCARVSIYEKGYKGYRNNVFGRPKVCMCFYLLSVMAYFYVVIIIHCHRIGYKRE